MSPNSYPKYKDSGVDWLNNVPEHWHITPLGKHFTLRNVTVSDRDFVPLSVTMSGIVPQIENVAKTENGDSRKLVRRGDFVINSRSDRKGSSGLSDYDGSVSQISIVLVPHRIAPKFTHHLLRSVPFQEEFYRFGTGIVADLWSTRFSSMKAIRLALPPISEQEAIAAYLDRETDEIDAFIADQEELIALLAERRTATITRAVTKGIDPSAPMKNSDIEWLNEVPIHWTVTSLKHYINVLPGYAFKSEDFTQEETDVRLLRGVNINPGSVKWGDVVRFDYSQRPDLKDYELQSGDLVLGLDRPIVSDGIRVASISDEDLPSLVLQRVARIRTKPRANKLFVRYLLESEVFANYLAPLFTGVSVPHMSPGQLGSFTVAMAPLTEQQEIVDYLERETSEIDAAIDDAREAIALSKERRAAVISATVTGKIDVRGLVTPEANNVEGVSVGIA